MYHSLNNFRAFISQFKKVKRLDLECRSSSREISFYKNEGHRSENDEFSGPYIVKDKFVLELINNGLLRISYLYTFQFLKELPEMKTKNLDIIKYFLRKKS
ncbi:hypothetical protein ACQ4LE_004469 [Meloidogyne hapla]